MESTKVGVLVTVLVLLVGVGMFLINNYSGAVVGPSGGNQCDEIENLFPSSSTGSNAEDTEYQNSIFKKGGTKTRSSSSAPWSQLIPETCSNNILTERYCLWNGQAASETVTCANGCAGDMPNGKCKLPACSDSDNGQTFATQGTTTGLRLTDFVALGVPPYTQSAKTYTDFCLNDTVLTEHYCYSSGSGSVEVRAINKTCITLGVNYICQDGGCILNTTAANQVSQELVCDNLDNNNNGQVDEGCDVDNDDYCSSSNGYTTVGNPVVCPNGGGDCADALGGIDALKNPGASENCFNSVDDNCNGQYNEGCGYTCSDTDPTNDATIGGTVTITASDGQTYVFSDGCSSGKIQQVNCDSSISFYPTLSNFVFVKNNCPAGTSCVDPDGSSNPVYGTGLQPAVCA